MKVYLDLLILSNFLLDYSILLYTGHITKEDIKITRIIVGSLVAVSSLSLLYISNNLLFLTLRLLYSLLIVYVAFTYTHYKKYLINLAVFYILNFLLAGILLSFNTQTTFVRIDFFNPKVWIILVISFIIANVLTYILKVSLIQNNLYINTKFKIKDREYQCYGFLDTGNETRSRSFQPVVYVNENYIKETIDEAYLRKHQIDYHYIDCQTLNHTSQLLIFKPGYFKVLRNKRYVDFDVYLSVFNTEESHPNSYKVILNKELLF